MADVDLTNLLLGIQNAPNQVPGRTLNNLNDFAQGVQDISVHAGDQLTNPYGIVHPFTKPTIFGPAIVRALLGFTRDQQRKAFGLPKE